MNTFFVWGSTIYGTSNEDSDIDVYQFNDTVKCFQNMDVQNITFDKFKERLNNMDIAMLEGYSLQFHDDKSNYHDLNIHVDIDKSLLRHSISSVCSNSFVKAKKKLTIEKDYDRKSSMKSLFHSLRIFDFGIQIATYGHITNFDSMNEVWKDIENDYATHNDEEILVLIKVKYKPMYNKLASMFRELCPKV